MFVMMLMGDKVIFNLDAAAIAAYDTVRDESRTGTWRTEWNLMEPEEQDVWRRAMAAGLTEYDPETFGRARTELIRLWKVVGPVVRPYLSLLTKEDRR